MVLHILIVGGGIAGLATALALRRAGHHVQVFEKSHLTPADTAGPVVHIGPRSNELLRSWGIDEKLASGVLINKIEGFALDGTRKESDADSPPGWMYYERGRLHQALRSAATAATGSGVTVELHVGAEAISVDNDSASITLSDGKVFKGDAIVGADGFGSAVRNAITTFDTVDITDQRVAVQVSVHAQSGPLTERFQGQPLRYEKWNGNGLELNVYSVEPGQLLFDCTLPKEATAEPSAASIKSKLIQAFGHEHSDLAQVLTTVNTVVEIQFWTQDEYPRIQTWTSDKVVLVGDAAHPFLPHELPGTSQALNDAAALASELSADVKADEVRGRLVAWEGPRKERLRTLPCFYATVCQ
ncbi:hypothetical protein BJX64DRAFT_295061 [Aspergillus heterothallicus]